MATERQQRKYPVGIQTFQKLREGNYLYIDKTEYVYKLANDCSKNIFLNRPKGFGKSLLTSTLRSYFEGRKELFKGLAIEKLESEWTEYPVLHFDMSAGVFDSKDSLSSHLRSELTENARRFGIDSIHGEGGSGLEELIREVNERTGRQVVVLIDEYDKPIIDFYVEQETRNGLKYMLMNFYIPLKACDPYIRFAFMTGTTKLSMADMFGGLNNMYNISMLPEYAAICGITKEEMAEQMGLDIAILAEERGKTKEQTLHDLTDYYDGYHFTWPSPDIFNPYSIMNAFCDGMIKAYWFGSGTPTYLIEMLRKYDVQPSEIGPQEAMAEDFDAPTESMTDITPLLYQSGYLTIKGYDDRIGLYTLDMPNKEVRLGLMESLLPNYMTKRKANDAMVMVAYMYDAIDRGDIDKALRLLQAFLLTIPYTANTNYEGHYQQVLYIILTLVGFYVDVEVHTPTGRVDMVMKTKDTLYLIELKLDKSADTAMSQIDLKDYAARFSLTGFPIVKVAVNFDSEKRTISDWKIEKQ